MLAAGLDGIDQKMACPAPVNNINIYELEPEELKGLGVGQLPGSLPEALDELLADTALGSALGEMALQAFIRAKRAECDEYRQAVTDWELERYLETA
jgi:glutamine synthetase